MNKLIRNIVAAAAVTFAGATITSADVVDFEDIAVTPGGFVLSGAGGSATSGGYTFTASAALGDSILVYNGAGPCSIGCWNNGTNILSAYNSDQLAPFEMVMTRNGGGAFNLLSFDTAPLFDSIGTGIQNLTLTGALAGGGTTSASIVYDALSGGQSMVPNFMSVTSVLFTSDAFWPAIDNLTVQPVPLPASLPFLAAGLGAFGFISRRRKGAAS